MCSGHLIPFSDRPLKTKWKPNQRNHLSQNQAAVTALLSCKATAPTRSARLPLTTDVWLADAPEDPSVLFILVTWEKRCQEKFHCSRYNEPNSSSLSSCDGSWAYFFIPVWTPSLFSGPTNSVLKEWCHSEFLPTCHKSDIWGADSRADEGWRAKALVEWHQNAVRISVMIGQIGNRGEEKEAMHTQEEAKRVFTVWGYRL